MNKNKILLVILVLAIAGFFRFYLLNEMPGGLFPDEAANGLDINLMEQGQIQPFYERGNGREALFFYMLWGSVKLFGRTPFAHHLVSALVGLLSVLGCFLFTKKLFSEFSEDPKNPNYINNAFYIALFAAFFMATSGWHTVLSRTAFRANLIPLTSTFALYFFLCAAFAKNIKARLAWAGLFGIMLALGLYTYIAFRIMGAVLIPLVFWPLLADLVTKPRLERAKKFIIPAVVSLLLFLATIFPIAKYFYTHPGSFVGRSGQVSVFNPELNGGHLVPAILEVAKESLFGYFAQGDLNWRHNISALPFLSPLISPFLALGLLCALFFALRYFFSPKKYWKDYKFFLLIGWFFGMLIPVITTAEGIPHGLRSIGTIPAVFVISAWMFHAIISKASNFIININTKYKVKYTKAISFSFKVTLVVFFAVLPIQTFSQYFIMAYNSPENYYSFRSDLTTVSEYLNLNGTKEHTYLVLDKFSVQTVEYMTTFKAEEPLNPRNQPYIQVDPEDSYKLKNLTVKDSIIFTQSSIFDIKKFKEFHPGAYLSLEYRNKFGQTVLAVYRMANNE